MKNFYYILENKIPKAVDTALEWGKWFEKNHEEIIVKKTSLTDIEISTVFIGLSSYLTEGGGLFETMIFGGKYDQYQVRSSTWDEAEKEHQKAVNLVQMALD